MTIVQDGGTATLLADGRVLFASGVDQSGAAAASAELYDPGTGKFGRTGAMTSIAPVGGASAALLSDGRVLIVGGSVPFTSLANAQLYEPQSGTFSPTGSMAVGRFGATATRLLDGHVLVAGGTGAGNAALSSAELYQP
jgi:hypothetical protein